MNGWRCHLISQYTHTLLLEDRFCKTVIELNYQLLDASRVLFVVFPDEVNRIVCLKVLKYLRGKWLDLTAMVYELMVQLKNQENIARVLLVIRCVQNASNNL